jgi:preprotein translocase subunit SecE
MTVMDIRKNHVSTEAAPKEAVNKAELVKAFAGDIKTEIRKISWTSPEELKAYTKIVIATTFAMGMGIYFVDLVIQVFLTSLATIIRMISG